MSKKNLAEIITKEQQTFYDKYKAQLVENYIASFPSIVDPDRVRELFSPIGYDKSNVQEYQGICKMLTKEIYYESLKRNKDKIKTVIFAAGLPATGKSSHLMKILENELIYDGNINENELIYDGTINNEEKFVDFIQAALDSGYAVEVIVYSADPVRAFKTNLERGGREGRYVPISHYEKVANTLNNRELLLKQKFGNRVKFRNFEYTRFEGSLKKFSPIKINRNELEEIAQRHTFSNSKILESIIK
ncbi:MAG: zeta toxin family protein [Bacteroidia bacterium]